MKTQKITIDNLAETLEHNGWNRRTDSKPWEELWVFEQLELYWDKHGIVSCYKDNSSILLHVPYDDFDIKYFLPLTGPLKCLAEISYWHLENGHKMYPKNIRQSMGGLTEYTGLNEAIAKGNDFWSKEDIVWAPKQFLGHESDFTILYRNGATERVKWIGSEKDES